MTDPKHLDRRTFLTLSAAAASLPAVSACARDQAIPASCCLILVRHAEKQKDADDPGLTEEGVARSQALASLLENAGVTHLISSEYRRTRMTLEPLARRSQVALETHSSRDGGGLADRLRSLEAGSVAVVAGHSNTIPELAAALGGQVGSLDPKGHIEEDEYARLFILTVAATEPGGRMSGVNSLELRYGE